MIKAHSDVVNAIQYNWDIPSEFLLETFNNSWLMDNSSALNNPWIGIKDGMDLFVEDVRIDMFTSSEISEYFAGQWSLAIGRLELRKMSITFRDYDKAKIYTSLVNYQRLLQHRYPKEQQWSIQILKESYSKNKQATKTTNSFSGMVGTVVDVIQSGSQLISNIGGVLGASSISSIGPNDRYLVNTNKAVLISVSGDPIGQGLGNQFTKVTAEFLYTDNLPLSADGNNSGGMGGFGDFGLGNLSGMANNFTKMF